MMFLSIVTDDELIVSETVKTILLAVLTGAVILNVVRLVRNTTVRKKVFNIVLLILFLGVWVYVFREFRLEAELLRHPVYVQGTTIGYCRVFARGMGIAFEYEIEGEKYRGCSTFYPVPGDSIKVPGGVYEVRCSKKFRSMGRMIFKKTDE